MIGSSFPREEDAFIEIVKGRARSGASLLTVFLIAWAAAPNQQAWTLHSGTMVLNVPSDQSRDDCQSCRASQLQLLIKLKSFGTVSELKGRI